MTSLLKLADSHLVKKFYSVLETLDLTAGEIGILLTECTSKSHISSRGVYCIAFERARKVYVGQSKNVPIRLRQHLSDMRSGTHRNKRVQNLYNKYGTDGLYISWVLGCQVDVIDDHEKRLIAAFNKTGCCINFDSGGNLNKSLSEEHKKKLSAAARGRPSPNRGKKATVEARLKMSLSHIGKPSPRKGIKTGKPSWNSGCRGVQDSTRRISVEATDTKTGNSLGVFKSIQHFCTAMAYRSKNYKKSKEGIIRLGRYALRDVAWQRCAK